jgi:hypothetical protein
MHLNKFNLDALNSAVDILDPYSKKKLCILNLCCKSCSPFLPERKQCLTTVNLTVVSGILKYALDSFWFLLICEEIKFPLLLHFSGLSIAF